MAGLVVVVFLQALKHRTVSFFVVLAGGGLGLVASAEAEVVHVQVSPLDSQRWHAAYRGVLFMLFRLLLAWNPQLSNT